MKKILSLILAGLMSLSCAAFVAADDAAAETTNSYEAYAIEFLANYGIFKGESAESFVAGADNPIQRYQMALFVARISTGWVNDYQWKTAIWEDGTQNTSTFTDIGEGEAANYLGALSYANQNGIIKGYSDTTFGPYDGITYQDALTMTVRTLGYTGLSYPWGYIQKATELELTEGIEAAMTKELTRGEVAVIIYNALFAVTKTGDTLAKKAFKTDFKWENIVIVASSKDSIEMKGETSPYADYVGFKVLDPDGNLSGDVYYVATSELGLDGHKADLAIGHVYYALFESQNGKFVKLVDADSMLYKTVQNEGRTDNEGVAVATYPIKAELANYKLVDSYSNYREKLAGKNSLTLDIQNQLKLFVNGQVEYVVGYNGNVVAIDADGNIRTVTVKDGKYEVGEVAWYYNQLLNRYYQLYVDTTSTDVGKVYINWMSDEEFIKWYNEKTAVTETRDEFKLSITEKGEAPYAKLQMFDTDFDGLAERALYKTYELGYFSNTTLPCNNGCNGAQKAAYTIKDIYGTTTKVNDFVEGACAHNGKLWINVDTAKVTGFQNEDGSYNAGTILYNYNKTTGEIEVVKYVEGKMDADSYYVTGTLTAYSVSQAKVLIDGTYYEVGYPEMTGYGVDARYYGNIAKDLTTQYDAAAKFDEMQMQVVNALVLDGKIVKIDRNTTDRSTIVVLGYAGQTNDGFWGVYGYSLKDLTVKLYRIASFNGWRSGDYKYYPQNMIEFSGSLSYAFMRGAIYTITSYDAENDAYNVYTEEYADIREKAAKQSDTQFTFNRGYRIETYYADGNTVSETKVVAMAAGDRYIVIDEYGMVNVWTGPVVDDHWNIRGKMLTIDGAYVFFVDSKKQEDIVGFVNNAYEVGFVYVNKVIRTDAAYDAAIGDSFLLGSTASKYIVFDLLTGTEKVVLAGTNLALKANTVYYTIGNTIIDSIGLVADQAFFLDDTLAAMVRSYSDENLATAKYSFRGFTFERDAYDDFVLVPSTVATKAELTDKLYLARLFEEQLVPAKSSDEIDEGINAKIAAAKIADGIAYIDMTGDTIGFADLKDNMKYTCVVSFCPATRKVVVYITGAETAAQ